MKYEPKLPRKPCGWSTCDRTIPVSWFFCKNRKCQDARNHWQDNPEDEAALVRQAAHRAAKYRQHALAHRTYLYAWRQLRRKTDRTRLNTDERRTFLENSRIRQELLEQALAMATGELRLLIEEQLADPKDRIKRTKSDPWGLRSLDAPLPGADDLTLADLLADDHAVNL